jgi:hypothetical protein
MNNKIIAKTQKSIIAHHMKNTNNITQHLKLKNSQIIVNIFLQTNN